MRRLPDAVGEWRLVRRRVRDEFAFHREQAQARGLRVGLSRAQRAMALRELGGDLTGLLALIRVHRVMGARAVQQLALALALLAMLVVSPDRRALVEAVVGTHLAAEDRASVFVSEQARNLTYRGIGDADLRLIAGLDGVEGVRRFGVVHGRATVRGEAGDLEVRVQRITGNAQLRVMPLYERASLPVGGARALWAAVMLAGLVTLLRGPWPRVGYGLAMLVFHGMAGLAGWSVMTQWWMAMGWGPTVVAGLALAFVGMAALQVRWWRRDLEERCPRCLEQLRMPLRDGVEGRLLLDPPSCESICIYGHGRLAVNHWARTFHGLLLILLTPLCFGQDAAAKHYEELIRRGTVTGAAFAAVDDGQVSGVAAFGQAKPDSLWRAASTTKVFTALAVMRLADEGRLDLDADVNRYLKTVRVPEKKLRPITARHLLTHKSGLDDRFVGSAYLGRAGAQPPMATVMREWLPARLYEPGEARIYTNFGYGLLGALIEDVTGQRYEEYVRQAVFAPLGMPETTLQQPLAAESRLVPALERSVFGWMRDSPTIYHRSVAGGGMTTTMSDLVHFVARVQSRQTDVVGRATLELMLGERALAGGEPEGYGFGFGVSQGQRYWYSGGDLGSYHTVIVWFPEHEKAFVTVAAGPDVRSTAGLIPKVMEQWFGPEPKTVVTKVQAHPQAVQFAAHVAGLYRPLRYPHRDLSKTFIVTWDDSVRAEPDGAIRYGGERWVAVERLRFRHESADRYLTFQEDERGRVRFLNRSSERIGWYESGRAAVAAYFLFPILSFVLLRISRGQEQARPLRRMASATVIHSLVWVGAVLIADPQRLILGMPWYVTLALGLVVVVAGCWIHLVVDTVRRVRLVPGLACVVYGVYLLFLYYWRVLPVV